MFSVPFLECFCISPFVKGQPNQPNRAQQNAFRQNGQQARTRATAETGLIVTDDPDTTGVDGDRFAMKDFPEAGHHGRRFRQSGAKCEVKDLLHYKERTPEESARWNRWCGLLGWYMAMKRVGATASFQ